MMHRRNQAMTNLRGVPLFATCTAKELSKIASLSTRVNVNAGRVVAQQGTRGREFIVIVSGTATVERDGAAIAHLAAGDYFGEIALIVHGPRSATVVADTDLVVDAFSRDEFRQLVETSPGLAARLSTEAARRLQTTTESAQTAAGLHA
jgi:CRP/FNR family transcriptional regulator, cyclic AMP receptor protein